VVPPASPGDYDAAHAEGKDTAATGVASHAEGRDTIAYGPASHAGGWGNGNGIYDKIIASGNASFIHFKQLKIVCTFNGLTGSTCGGVTGFTNVGGTGAHGHYSAILGGTDHNIEDNATSSGIFAGADNLINNGIIRSVILGGQNITGTTSDTVYVPKLNIGTVSSGPSQYNLGIDSSGFVVTGTTGTTTGTSFSWSDPIVKSGNTSGDCITELWVNTISGCSSVTIGSSIRLEGALGTPGLIYAQPSGGMISGDISTSYGGHGFKESGAPRIINKNGDESMALCIDHPYDLALDYKNNGGVDEILRIGVTTSGGTSGLTSSFGTGIPVGVIINSNTSKIASGVTQSAIIGGVLITATTDNTVYVPNLNIGTVGGGTPSINLGLDSSGYVVTGTTGGGGGGGTGTTCCIDPYNNVGSASTLTWDVSGTSTNYKITLTANTILTMSNVRDGDSGNLIIFQDSAGNRELTFGGGTHYIVNGGGGTPTLTTNINARDILSFTYDGDEPAFYWTVGNDYT